MPDILDNLTRVADAPPALNATSDMPVIEPPTPEPQPAPSPEPAPAAAPEPAAAEPPAPEPRPDARERREQRFAELTRQRDAERERAAATDARLEKALAALERVSAPPVETPTAPAEEPRPTREAFETPEDYDAALIGWSATRAAREATRVAQAEYRREQEAARQAEAERQANEAQQRTQDEVVQSWNTKRAAAIEKYPDFAEVAEGEVPITLPMRDAILSLDDGTEIAYHLGKNPQEADRIAKLTPVRQVAEIGRLAAQLAAPAPTPPPPPPPINPLRGGANSAGERNIYTNEPSMDDYAATRLQELRAERKTGMLGIPRAN